MGSRGRRREMAKKAGARLTASEAKARFLRGMEELWDRFDAWYRANPEATFDEMDKELGRQRRTVLGQMLELRLRQDDLGATPEAPLCDRCGKRMVFKGYPTKRVQGLDVEAEISRAYFHCPTCKVGSFPPRLAAEAEEGEL
jgi:hypothetical protein